MFHFHVPPEASVDPRLVAELVDLVELSCAPEVVLERLGNASRREGRTFSLIPANSTSPDTSLEDGHHVEFLA